MRGLSRVGSGRAWGLAESWSGQASQPQTPNLGPKAQTLSSSTSHTSVRPSIHSFIQQVFLEHESCSRHRGCIVDDTEGTPMLMELKVHGGAIEC